jgi:hypothetical protein
MALVRIQFTRLENKTLQIVGFEGFCNVNNFESIQGKSAIALNLNTLEKFESILILNGKTFTFSPFFYNSECTLVRYFIRFVGFSQD